MTTFKPLALVTGASSGIGEMYARRLAGRGYALLLVARRKDRLERLAAELGHAEVLAADLTNDSQCAAVEARIASEDRLDFLVNNAGFGTLGPFHKSDMQEQEQMHRLHVFATMRLMRAALAGMVARRRGHVVNVSSAGAFFPNPSGITYNATKAYINCLTEGVHLELRSIGSPVRVQALCPGFTYSEFHDVIGMDRSLIPSWMWLQAEEVVDASLRALDRNRVLVVWDWRYRWLVRAYGWMPRRLQHAVALKYGSRRRPRPA